jgi:hypothetical protein
MDRIVVARAAAIESELVAADRRQHDRLDRVAHLDLVELGSVAMIPSLTSSPASGLRTTGDAVPLATSLPDWSFIEVSETTNHSAPPFLSYMSVTFCWQVIVSPT